MFFIRRIRKFVLRKVLRLKDPGLMYRAPL